jgi:aldehyde:ferredoxin oxidoreductase
MLFGYAGKLLKVDLATWNLNDLDLNEQIAEKFIGGYGIGSRLLYDLIPAHADPLGPENILAVLTGPLTGSGVPTGTRWTICCKSPLTGTWGDANGSGFFGPALKASGFDGVLFHGISQQPVYLLIIDGKASLIPADDLWGLDTYTTDDLLKQRHGKNAEIICVGPAGEHLSLIAGVVHAKGRTAARSGVGAVMGSKKIKAVVAIGTQKLKIAHPEEARRLRSKYTRQISRGTGSANFYRTTGTPGYIVPGVDEADSPIRNWRGVPEDFPQVKAIGVEQIFGLGRNKRSCWQCPVSCWGEIPLEGKTVHQPEYETSAAFGSNLLMSNLITLLKCNDLCNRYGLDTISAGATIAFAIECCEVGLIKAADLPISIPTWGNPEAILALLYQIAHREGFGALFSDGSLRAAQKIGQGSEQYAMQVGGQEIAMHDPRYEPGLGLIYLTDATPGRHSQAAQFIPAPELQIEGYAGFGKQRENQVGRGLQLKPMSLINHIVNASGLCLFGYLSTTILLLPDWLTAVTGKMYDLNTVITCGERISNIRQAFNIREGINFLEFKLPSRAYGVPPQKTGPTADITVDIQGMLKEYLSAMDWGLEKPVPSQAKLESLGLSDIARDLWG